ncbi:ATP-dependent translocase ABCB1-like isoform X2 [Rhopilema esculentum]|uniref:ATP-dependent translocase ABCB1-like isoform X2 n=1 Tax=Rhopilema esculentum TaxID=499914 RepID=UPI0031D05D42
MSPEQDALMKKDEYRRVSVASNSSKNNDANESSSKDDKTKEPEKLVTTKEVFQFADKWDIICMILGTIFAMGNGVAQPCSFLVFGELIGKFISFATEAAEIAAKAANATKTGNATSSPLPIAMIDIDSEMETFAAYYTYIGIGTIVCGYVQTAFWSVAAVRQAHRIRTNCFKSIMGQEIGWFDTTDSGELSTRLTDDVTKIQNGIGDKVAMVVQSISMFLAGFLIGFIYSWKLTLVILSVTPALMITGGITGKVIGNLTSQEQTAYAKAGGIAEEVLGSIRTVVAFGGEKKEYERYSSSLYDSQKAGIKKGMSTGIAFGLFHVVIFSCYALAFWYGSQLIADNELNGGDVLVVFFCVMVGGAQIGQAGPNMEAIAKARGAAYYVYYVINKKSEIDPFSEEGQRPDRMLGNVQFSKIHFNYPSRPEVKILKGFSLDIKSGMTVALVGESGCGKSTVVKLVQRFYDAVNGGVMIDGIGIEQLNVSWLRRHIGVVSQEPVLFEGSIAENIRMGKDDASDQEIEQAAQNANAHTFISELPKGYDTFVGEGGAQLSGGQKQRIAIARALIRDPKILLLDEATSALDTESESIVQAALDKASQGRTTIIIAHRLSTVRNADLIVAVQDGAVAEQGTHDELIEKKGVYYQLVMLQTLAEELDDEEKDNLSLLSEEDREQQIALKVMRQVSNLSQGSEEDIKEVKALERVLSRKLSHKGAKPAAKSQKEKEKKDEEVPEEEVEMPSVKRLMLLNSTEWPYLAIGSFFAAIVGAFPVAFAIILSEILKVFADIDKAKLKSDAEFWALMFLALGIADGVSLFTSSYCFSKAGEILTLRLRQLTFKALLRQEIGYFDDPAHSTGALTARLATDATGVQGATSLRLSTMVQVGVMGLTAIVIAFAYEWKLTLLIFAFVPFLMIAGGMHTKMMTSFAEEENKKIIEAGAAATESIINIRTVVSLGKEQLFWEKYMSLLQGPYEKSKVRCHLYGISFGFSMGIMFFCNAAAFRLGGYLVQKGDVAFHDMFKVIMALTFGAMIAGQIASFAPDYVKAKTSAARIFKLLDREPLIDAYDEGGERPSHVDGAIEFDEVKFHYPSRPDVTVLHGLTVRIQPGQTLALVGSSGCGKSTSVSLIERFYDVASGSIKLDGADVRSLNIAWLRSHLGIVSQEPVLFDCSIKDNILYGIPEEEKEKISMEQVEEVAKSANIHHFISNLPKGYETTAGDKGALISGGQKQRIAIARALIRNPSIMLLDEATSALDSESEKIVQDALDVAMEGRTSIVIAHRLSTIQNADIIAVVQGGKIIEMGTHSELLAKKGAYCVLNAAQL